MKRSLSLTSCSNAMNVAGVCSLAPKRLWAHIRPICFLTGKAKRLLQKIVYKPYKTRFLASKS